MAHEAFALSPISARAAQPSETDYEEIREAFLETARGRWFLGEYAKRNRHADTRMVLDAVARIEQTLETLQQPLADTQLAEILAMISNVVDQAAETAASAVDRLAIEERLAPIREGARILKQISWRWREIGTESRICDSIDSQVGAILESCRQLAGIDIRAGLTESFELIRTRIEALAEDDGKAVPPAAAPATMPDAAAVPVATEVDGVAEQVELAPTRAADDVVPPWMQPEPPAATILQLHPQLGSAPSTNEILEQRRPPDNDPFSAIRRMSLPEKIEFFS
jgi:hypothetical protein